MNVLQLNITSYKFFRRRKWIRKLRLLNAIRPNLLRSEYVGRVTEMGYELKKVKVVYNVINEYMSLDEFSMYPEDNVKHYLRDTSDLTLLLKKIYSKLKIIRSERANTVLNNHLAGPLTVMVILDNISEG